MVCLATAHPAKFPDSVNAAVGADLARHPRLQGLRELDSRRTAVPPELNAIKDFIARHARMPVTAPPPDLDQTAERRWRRKVVNFAAAF
jgi:threonine synthase